MRLLHPITPFITEELWQHLSSVHTERGGSTDDDQFWTTSVMERSYPGGDVVLLDSLQDDEAEREMTILLDVVHAARSLQQRASQLVARKEHRIILDAAPESDVGRLVSTHCAALEQLVGAPLGLRFEAGRTGGEGTDVGGVGEERALVGSVHGACGFVCVYSVDVSMASFGLQQTSFSLSLLSLSSLSLFLYRTTLPIFRFSRSTGAAPTCRCFNRRLTC